MMYLYNITFATSPLMEGKLLDYLKNILIPNLLTKEAGIRTHELRKVVEIGGRKPDAEQGVSIALAVSFESERQAREWHDTILEPALTEFQLKFGRNALFFITFLQNLL